MHSEFVPKVSRALYQEAQIEMKEAQRRCPVWNPERPVPAGHTPGSLRASGMVHQPVVDGQDISCRLTFGGPAVPYAFYVHEDVEAFHATGQSHYLSSVVFESAPYMAERVMRRVREA